MRVEAMKDLPEVYEQWKKFPEFSEGVDGVTSSLFWDNQEIYTSGTTVPETLLPPSRSEGMPLIAKTIGTALLQNACHSCDRI